MKDLIVDKDIAKAEGLPARAFTEPAILDLELETIFKTNWLLVPESSGEDARADARPWDERLKQRGARAPITMMDRPLFLQRGWKDGELRLLPNVCTHAWYPLVAGEGRSEKLICAQHGRQFDASGKALSQPGFPPKAGVFPARATTSPRSRRGSTVLSCSRASATRRSISRRSPRR
ncbi:MAG: Rieske 2Fe-2S domain-containing protein [Elusimicrobiota bacterium]|nr:MAG: Rieske 2Fe-2S domain-containing protein [Elusimicrobiota bacterium]